MCLDLYVKSVCVIMSPDTKTRLDFPGCCMGYILMNESWESRLVRCTGAHRAVRDVLRMLVLVFNYEQHACIASAEQPVFCSVIALAL